MQKGKYDNPRKSADMSSAYVYNKRKEYYGSTSKLQNDTYESVCAPEDTEERNQVAQRNGMVAANNPNINNNRLLKRVVSAPVGIETPKGERINFTFHCNSNVTHDPILISVRMKSNRTFTPLLFEWFSVL